MYVPRRWAGSGWNQVLNAMSVRYTNQLFIEAREIIHYKEILIASWSLPASHAADYQELVGKARENLTTIAGRVTFGRIHPAAGALLRLTRKRWTVLWFLFWFAYLVWMIIGTAADKH
jgi:hypothetical protein